MASVGLKIYANQKCTICKNLEKPEDDRYLKSKADIQSIKESVEDGCHQCRVLLAAYQNYIEEHPGLSLPDIT
jgi:hypothetical protein